MQNNNGTTPGSTADAKKAIRREKISARKSLTAEYRRAADQAVCRNLAEIAGDFQGNVLVGYVTDGTEPDVNALMQTHLDHGGILCVPRFESATDYRIVTVKDLHFTSSKWGIPEPDASAPETDAALLKKALWLIPGVAFDESLMRLGRGKGVYDRLLQHGFARTVGVFYECQKCEKIPSECHDCSLDMIVTENGIYKIN